MKPLSKDEVADVMKKEVPMLLHKRILELERSICAAFNHGNMEETTRKFLSDALKKGIEI